MREIALFRVQAGSRVDTPLCRLADGLAGFSGWRRYGLAFVLGAGAAAALPPFDLTPLLAVVFTSLLWLDDGSANPWASFRLGWVFGFGFFSPGSIGSRRRCLSTSIVSGGWCRLLRRGCRRDLRCT